jgi:hypothetical protein
LKFSQLINPIKTYITPMGVHITSHKIVSQNKLTRFDIKFRSFMLAQHKFEALPRDLFIQDDKKEFFGDSTLTKEMKLTKLSK